MNAQKQLTFLWPCLILCVVSMLSFMQMNDSKLKEHYHLFNELNEHSHIKSEINQEIIKSLVGVENSSHNLNKLLNSVLEDKNSLNDLKNIHFSDIHLQDVYEQELSAYEKHYLSWTEYLEKFLSAKRILQNSFHFLLWEKHNQTGSIPEQFPFFREHILSFNGKPSQKTQKKLEHYIENMSDKIVICKHLNLFINNRNSLEMIKNKMVKVPISENLSTLKQCLLTDIQISKRRQDAYLNVLYILILLSATLLIHSLYKQNLLNKNLNHYNQNLEKVVLKRTKDLINAQKDAEQASLAKGQFLDTVSHELRTPMNGIIGFSQILKHTDLDEEQETYLKNIFQSGYSLLNIINNILTFSKFDEKDKELNITDFNIKELLDEVHKEVSIHVKSNVCLRVDIDSDLALSFKGDYFKIRQMLTNLLLNSAKFTEKGQIQTSFKISSSVDDCCMVQLIVDDTGVGISETQRQTIFQAFSQANQSWTRRYEGIGLGLNICTQLATQLGGAIKLLEKDGPGTRFCIHLPLQKS